MAITYNGITLRNLEEQVLENKEQIAKHWNVDRVLADFGIKVMGRLDTKEELDTISTAGLSYGDAYLIGTTEPYDVWIWTRPDINAGQPVAYWLDIGHIAIEGPAGPAGKEGPAGPTGVRGSKWGTSVSTVPIVTDSYEVGDQWLTTINGMIYELRLVNGIKSWVSIGSIRGTQGPQGIQGPVGPQGEQGPAGPQGPQGDVGGFINIWGILTNVGELPSPAILNDLTIAYLVGSSSPYNLYVQIGQNSASAIWTDTGPFNAGTLISVGGVAQNLWDADTKVDKITTKTTGFAGRRYAYGINYDGSGNPSDVTLQLSSSPLAYSIAAYADGGRLRTNDPAANTDTVNLQYANNKFMPKPDSASNCLIGWVNDTGIQIKYFTNYLPMDGRFCTAIATNSVYGDTEPNLGGTFLCPTPTKPFHVVNKDYADTLVPSTSAGGYDNNDYDTYIHLQIPSKYPEPSDYFIAKGLTSPDKSIPCTITSTSNNNFGPGAIYYDENESAFHYKGLVLAELSYSARTGTVTDIQFI